MRAVARSPLENLFGGLKWKPGQHLSTFFELWNLQDIGGTISWEAPNDTSQVRMPTVAAMAVAEAYGTGMNRRIVTSRAFVHVPCLSGV